MSRAERRQYQRTVGRRGAANPYPAPPGRSGREVRGRSERGGQAAAARSASDLRFTRRFWIWTLAGAFAAGLLMLSVSWDPAVRSGTASLAFGFLGAAGWIAGAVASRLVRRRLSAR